MKLARIVEEHDKQIKRDAESHEGEREGKMAKTSEDVVMNLAYDHEMTDCGMVVKIGDEKLSL